MTTPLLCRDCAHCRETTYGLKCAHPSVPLRDLATGEREYAFIARRNWPCGEEAKLFEQKMLPAPRISLWERIMWRIWRWARSQ